MSDIPRPRFPWLLVVASVLLAVLFAYVMFGAYLPAKRQVVRLEAELKELYRREGDFEARLAQQEKSHALREQQLVALTAERDALVQRLEELERELGAARRRR